MKLSHALLIGCLVVAGLTSLDARGETFVFGSGSQNNINGAASASLTKGAFTMQLLPALSGSLLSEVSSAGMGINSTPVAGTDDGQPSLFNVLGGSGPLAGTGEGLQFSFLQPGVLTGINFDGVKDESLEYFILESPGREPAEFFRFGREHDDSRCRRPVPLPTVRLRAASFICSKSIRQSMTRRRICTFRSLPASRFTLTFRSLGPTYHPLVASNGARLQGVTVQAVPEPSGIAIVVGLALVGLARPRDEAASGRRIDSLVSELLVLVFAEAFDFAGRQFDRDVILLTSDHAHFSWHGQSIKRGLSRGGIRRPRPAVTVLSVGLQANDRYPMIADDCTVAIVISG